MSSPAVSISTLSRKAQRGGRTNLKGCIAKANWEISKYQMNLLDDMETRALFLSPLIPEIFKPTYNVISPHSSPSYCLSSYIQLHLAHCRNYGQAHQLKERSWTASTSFHGHVWEKPPLLQMTQSHLLLCGPGWRNKSRMSDSFSFRATLRISYNMNVKYFSVALKLSFPQYHDWGDSKKKLYFRWSVIYRISWGFPKVPADGLLRFVHRTKNFG